MSFLRAARFGHLQQCLAEQQPRKHRAPTNHRTADSSATFSALLGASLSSSSSSFITNYGGVLRDSCGAARQSLPYKYYKTSAFRKAYLRIRMTICISVSASKTAYSRNAEFMTSFCTLWSEVLCEAAHFYGTLVPTRVCITSNQHVTTPYQFYAYSFQIRFIYRSRIKAI